MLVESGELGFSYMQSSECWNLTCGSILRSKSSVAGW